MKKCAPHRPGRQVGVLSRILWKEKLQHQLSFQVHPGDLGPALLVAAARLTLQHSSGKKPPVQTPSQNGEMLLCVLGELT